MPTVKIELQQGKDKKTLIQLRNLVMDSVVDVLQLPADDRNIRIIEFHPDLFQMKPPYEILIEISLFIGRTKEVKKILYQTIVERLESKGIADKNKVFIVLNEIPAENWGIRGGIPADEINLSFKINV